MFGLQLGRLGIAGSLFNENALWPLGASSPGLRIDGPSYPEACWQDSAGTTALSTVGTVLDSSNPVGLMLDRKGGLVLGTNVAEISDCVFSTYSDQWLSLTLNSSKSYLVLFDYVLSSGQIYLSGNFPGSPTLSVTNTGRYSAIITGATSCGIHSHPAVGTASNISVREIPGLHLSQSTSAARPVASARKNLLVGTDALATQSVTVIAAQCVLSFTGTGTVTLSGVSTAGPLVGTGAADRVSLTFTPTAGSLTLTVSGSVTFAQLEYRA